MPARVAIVGLGAIFPRAFTLEQFWDHVGAGRDTACAVPPGRWVLPPEVAHTPGPPQPDHVYSARGYFIDGFSLNPAGLQLDAAELARLDPVHHLTLQAGRAAWQSAVTAPLTPQRVGVILGSIILPTDTTSKLTESLLGKAFPTRSLQAEGGWGGGKASFGFPLTGSQVCPLDETPASILARALGLAGPAFCLDAACASSLYAVKLAVAELQGGRLDAVLAGGVSRPDCLYTQMGFCQLRALASDGRCAPFDRGGTGLVVGEGAGIFVLKRLADALADGDNIHAVIAGIGLSNDVQGNLLAPSSEGQLRALRAAYEDAGWPPESVDCIECHATGTPVGDTVEFNSLLELWRARAWNPHQCVIGSVKSNFGHTLTAAGAAGVLKLLLALRHQTLPPTANFCQSRPEMALNGSPFRILTRSEAWPKPSGRPRRAAISGFGFGGINAHVLLEEWTGEIGASSSSTPQQTEALVPVSWEAQVGSWASQGAVRRQWLSPEQPSLQALGDPTGRVAESEWLRREFPALPSGGSRAVPHPVSPGEFHIPPHDLAEMLPQQLLMLQVAARLLRPLRWQPAQRLRAGAFIGVNLDLNTTNYHLRWWLKAQCWPGGQLEKLPGTAGPALTPGRVLGGLASITASRIAREFGLGGPSFTVSSGPESGLTALHIATDLLRRGEIDLALVGAVDFCTDVRAVLTRCASPAGQYIPADAAVALVLQRASAGPCDEEFPTQGFAWASSGLVPTAGQLAARNQERLAVTLGYTGAASGLLGWVLALNEPREDKTPATPNDMTWQKPHPPAWLAQFSAAQEAQSAAHAAHLRFVDRWQNVHAEQLTAYVDLAGNAPINLQVAVPEASAFGVPLPETAPPQFDRPACLEFAVGSSARVLGPDFAEVDSYPTRVRLPDEPLMLVDRIVALEGEKLSLKSGRIITEHDVLPGNWYLDQGCIPAALAIESGQADLFLSAWLGADFQTRGLAMYRLLDAEVTFHRGLPGPGSVLRYDIHIDRFFRQGETHLFRFRFAGTVDGEPLLTMRDGCAGFFTPAALAAGQGIVQAESGRLPPLPAEHAAPHLVAVSREKYAAGQLDALRQGDLVGCFGSAFAQLPLVRPLQLPTGQLRLLDRVPLLDPEGGKYRRGVIRAELDIDPEAWFLTCHFVDDRVMPGTLMYECCLQALRLYLMRLGWVAEEGTARFEPVPGLPARLKCRGQVIASTRTATFEIAIKQMGYRPEPFAVADALMYADGKGIVEVSNLSLRLAGMTRETLEALWQAGNPEKADACGLPLTRVPGERCCPFDRSHILEFATGSPVRAFGERYTPFESERRLARLPAPPYSFLERIINVTAQQWVMAPGGEVQTEYTVPANAWYFRDNGQPRMPFAVLLEVALQSCGWLAAYMGSALHSQEDLRFRNLGGRATQQVHVLPTSGTLTTRARVTRVSHSAGMIIQHYDFEVSDTRQVVYQGETYFGFFTDAALAQQVGIRAGELYQPTAAELKHTRPRDFPRGPGWPAEKLRLVDHLDLSLAAAGPSGLGVVQGSSRVDPQAWYFQAHFYQDPVCPGSLGLEAFLQLLRVAAQERFGASATVATPALGCEHKWIYRGQVLPSNQQVVVQALIRECATRQRRLQADGWLAVDGLVIYQMQNFTAQGDDGHS